jgi:hypothetical protein
MGLFTNRCVNPECDNRVRKGAQFCPKCGTGAPKGVARCGACGAEVRTSSKFCWKCGCDLGATAKPLIAGDRWSRRPEEFAVRVDDQDVKGWLTKPLIVEHGTRAMLFQAGRLCGEIGEGRHNVGGLLKQLNHFMIDQAISVVVMDAGDVSLDLENAGLWTADHFEVGCVNRVILRVRDPDAMFVNLFKGNNHVGLDDLETQLAGEVQMLLGGIVVSRSAEDLFTRLEFRDEIEAALRENIAGTLGRLGLELVQLRFINFAGAAYEELRAKQGQLQVEQAEAGLTDERAKLTARLRETMTRDKMDQFKNEQDLADFIRQAEHELGLKEVLRADELARLTERFQFDRNRDGALRRIEIEGITDTARREKAWQELLADERQRDQRQRGELARRQEQAKGDVEVHRLQVEVKRLDHAEEMRQQEEKLAFAGRAAKQGLEMLKGVKEIEAEEADREQRREAERLKARGQATVEALLSIVDGPAADRIVAMERLRAQKGMSPDQILALAAEASPEAARALARKYEADGQLAADRAALLERQLADQRQMSDGHADRMERLMQTALGQMGAVAATRARPEDGRPTVVVPSGGLGSPVVVSSQAAAPAAACRHCHAAMEQAGDFCPQCGKKQ